LAEYKEERTPERTTLWYRKIGYLRDYVIVIDADLDSAAPTFPRGARCSVSNGVLRTRPAICTTRHRINTTASYTTDNHLPNAC